MQNESRCPLGGKLEGSLLPALEAICEDQEVSDAVPGIASGKETIKSAHIPLFAHLSLLGSFGTLAPPR